MEDNWFDNTPAMIELYEKAVHAVDIVAHLTQGDAQRKAPVEKGTLRGSATVVNGEHPPPEKTMPVVIESEVQFTVEYAAKQEEEDAYEHPMGGEAHYLAGALKANGPSLPVILGKMGLA